MFQRDKLVGDRTPSQTIVAIVAGLAQSPSRLHAERRQAEREECLRRTQCSHRSPCDDWQKTQRSRSSRVPKSTLRGQWVFGVFDEQGEPLCWVGRNLKDEEQMAKLRPGDEAPAKYRFPSQKLFRRKFVLYGQESLDRPELQDSLEQNGLLIVEGFWDVLRLRQLCIASVGIMSNHITDEQLARFVTLAQAKAVGRIGIMFDADKKGDEGAKDALWKLSVARLRTRLVWSRQMFNATFKRKEPESISEDELTAIEMHLA